MIPFKPSSERTLAHQLLTFVKLATVLKTEKKKLQNLKDTRPKVISDFIKWEDLNHALHHESEIARTEQRIKKLHDKTEEYEKELIQYIPSYLYKKTIEINLYGDDNQKRYSFLLRVISNNEVTVTVVT
jgi:hypothetical protein